MYIALNNDGTYKVYKKLDKLYKHLSYIKYIILEISTDLKGEIYTIIDAMNINVEYGDIEVKLDVEYESVDCPCNDTSSFYSLINIDNIERYYSIYPLIKQMLIYNYFMDNFMYDGPNINIVGISLYSDKFNITLDSYNMSDGKITKIFKKLRMDTCVSKITKYTKFLILKNGEWYVSESIPKHFDYVGIEMIGTESMYLLTEKQYKLLSSIVSLTIQMRDETIYDDGYFEDLVDSRDGNELLYFTTNKLAVILQSCLFFPQMLLLEHKVYNSTVSLEITVETKDVNYELTISEKEAKYGICLFDILNKLLTI